MSGMHHPPRSATRSKATPFRRAILAGIGAVTGLVAIVAVAGAHEPQLGDTELARSTSPAPTIPAIDTLSSHMTALVDSEAVPFRPFQQREPARRASRPRAVPTPTVPATIAPPPPPPPLPAPVYGDPYDVVTWDRLASCESAGNWAIDTGNGYYGGLQFTLESWQGVGGPAGYPHQHSRDTQILMAIRLWETQGWEAWPSCSSQLGYR